MIRVECKHVASPFAAVWKKDNDVASIYFHYYFSYGWTDMWIVNQAEELRGWTQDSF